MHGTELMIALRQAHVFDFLLRQLPVQLFILHHESLIIHYQIWIGGKYLT